MKAKNYVTYLSLLLVASLLMYMIGSVITKETPASVANYSRPTVIIDAGHGGEDGGAIAPDGTLEKELNLQVALKLETIFKVMGYNVIMIRTTDKDISSIWAKTTRNRKHTDLLNRAKILADNKGAVYLSVHMNKFVSNMGGKYSGAEVYYSKNNPDGEALAASIQNSIKETMQPYNDRGIKKADKNIYVLNTAKNLAILVECGFLSNYDELSKLKNDKYQTKLAMAIYVGYQNSGVV